MNTMSAKLAVRGRKVRHRCCVQRGRSTQLGRAERHLRNAVKRAEASSTAHPILLVRLSNGAVTACLWTAALTPSFAGMQGPAASPDASPDRHAAERASARAEAEAWLRDRGAVLAADFIAEPHDAAWAASAGKVLRRVLGDRAAGAPMAGASIDAGSMQAQVGFLQDRVEALAQELSLVRQQLDRGGAREARSAAPAVDVLSERNDPVARAAAEQAARIRDAAREASFRAEPADPVWAGKVSVELRNALAGDAETPPLPVRSIECRSRSCRVEIEDGATGDADRAVSQLAWRMAASFKTLSLSRIDMGGGASVTVLYWTR